MTSTQTRQLLELIELGRPPNGQASKFDSHAAVAMHGFFLLEGGRVFRSFWLAEPSEHTSDFAAQFGLQEMFGTQLATCNLRTLVQIEPACL